MLQILGIVSMATLVYYTLTTALKSYATTSLSKGGTIGASESDAFLALSIGLAVFIALQYPFGALADKIGRRNLMLIDVVVVGIIIVPLSKLISTSLTQLIFVFVVGLGIFAATTAVLPAILSDLLPPNLRGVGLGSWYNITIALFGGTAPLVITALTNAHHSSWFFWYIVVMCCVTIVALLSAPDERKRIEAYED